MPFKPPSKKSDFSSLVVSLDASKIQQSNFSLYQTIFFLIQNAIRDGKLTQQDIDTINEDVSTIFAANFLTHADETLNFPNSRNLLAGSGIAFDDTVAGERTISATSTGGFVPMTTGAEPLEIMSNGAGEVLLIGFETSQPV